MSYILSALQKAERERVGVSALSSEAIIEQPVLSVTPNRPLPWVSMVLLVLFIVIALAGYQLGQGKTVMPEVQAESSVVGNLGTDNTAASENAPVSQAIIAQTGSDKVDTLTPPRPADITVGKTAEHITDSAADSAEWHRRVTGYIYFADNPARSKLFIDGIAYRLASRLPSGEVITAFKEGEIDISLNGEHRSIAVRP